MADDAVVGGAKPTYEPAARGLVGYCMMLMTGGQLPKSADATRVTLLYFAAVTLRTLVDDGDAAARAVWTEDLRRRVVAWVYTMQLSVGAGGGFAQTHTMHGCGLPAEGHVTATQCALLTLLMCGDDLSRVDRDGVATMLRRLQLPSGCFQCVSGGEADVRFVYSACVTAALLDLPDTAFDRDAAVAFLLACESYDGGFGGNPSCEGHGGTTFCAVASLVFLNALDRCDVARTRRWVMRRITRCGVNGRPGKPADTCYTYWVGTTSLLLEKYGGGGGGGDAPLFDVAGIVDFVQQCTSGVGLIGKDASCGPDPLHTALALLGLRNLGGIASGEGLDMRFGCPRGLLAALPV